MSTKTPLKIISLVFSSLILVLPGVVYAQPPASDELVGIQTLDYAMDHINCRVEFTVNYINFLTSSSPDSFSDLSSYIQVLQTDQSTLQNYTISGDVASFRNYIKKIFDPNFRQINNLIAFELSNPNIAPNIIVGARGEYASLLSIYRNCAFGSLNNYATNKLNAYNNIITNYQLEMFSLNSKGMDISPLVALLQDATDRILNPLSDAVNKVNPNSNAVYVLRTNLNKYCLFDGCTSGINYHLSANFETAKLQLVLNYMEKNPKYSAAKAQFSQTQASLDQAKSMLSSVGHDAYNSADIGDNIWSNIYSASSNLRDVVTRYGE